MMSKLKFALYLMLIGVLNACALGDAINVSPLPPVTLAAPPALNLVGVCDDTKNLETWLQISTVLRDNFQTKMNTAAVKSKADMLVDVLSLAALRDSAFAAATPDCAAETAMKLGDTMNQAISAFQLYLNGSAPDLGNTITATNEQMDGVAAAQNDLIDRMTTQFQQQQATAAP